MNKAILGVGAIVLIAVAGFVLLGSSSSPDEALQPTPAPVSNIQVEDTNSDNMNDSGSSDDVVDNSGPYAPLVEYSEMKLAEAATNGRAVVMFHASWCPTCKAALEDFRSNADQIPEDVTLFRADYDTATGLKDEYNVVAQDTFVQVDAQGNELVKWNSGGRGVSALIDNII